MTPVLRPDTDDLDIWREVYVDNEYQLPDNMTGMVVLDIGAHVGAFSLACLERGAAKVVACEPARSAAECYMKNIEDYASKILFLRVAVNSYRGKAFLRHYKMASGYSIHLQFGDGEDVEVMDFESIISGNDEWDIVKIDAEWSEYDIISKTPVKRIRKGKRYFIESHLPDRHQQLRGWMISAGYRMDWNVSKMGGKIELMAFTRGD